MMNCININSDLYACLNIVDRLNFIEFSWLMNDFNMSENLELMFTEPFQGYFDYLSVMLSVIARSVSDSSEVLCRIWSNT